MLGNVKCEMPIVMYFHFNTLCGYNIMHEERLRIVGCDVKTRMLVLCFLGCITFFVHVATTIGNTS